MLLAISGTVVGWCAHYNAQEGQLVVRPCRDGWVGIQRFAQGRYDGRNGWVVTVCLAIDVVTTVATVGL